MARIGTVGYLNARPLSDRVDIDRHTLVLAHPAEVARMLRDAEVDVALVPAAAVLEVPERYRVVPGSCIGSAGPVGSVLLVAESPPESWTRVLLDGVSRTSVLLARLLLTRGPLASRVRPDLEIVAVGPNEALPQAKRSVAALVIGDAARVLPERLSVRVDLASVWAEWTGLPFVFAVWAGRPDLDPAVVRHLMEAGREGVAAIAGGYAGEDRRYLLENLRYPLDDEALMGLRRFAALAAEAGLVPSGEFELYGPEPRLPRPDDLDGLLARVLDGSAVPIGELLALLRHASPADLASAAELKRREVRPGDEVSVRTEVALAEGEPLGALPIRPSRIRLRGAPTAEWIRSAAALAPGVPIAAEGVGEADPAALAAAGLTEIIEPVGSLSDRVRAERGEEPASRWLSWAARAARAGLGIEATIALGLGETDEELAARLLLLRDLPGLRAVRVCVPQEAGFLAATATDLLRGVALARLVLPAAVRVVAPREGEGLGVEQICLRAGCDCAEPVAIASAAELDARLAALEHQVTEAGLRPVREASLG